MELIVLGIVCSFNFCVILRKWKLKRYFDTIVDCVCLATISFLFSGTYSGFVVGQIASLGISIWLYFYPLTLSSMLPSEDDTYIPSSKFDALDMYTGTKYKKSL